MPHPVVSAASQLRDLAIGALPKRLSPVAESKARWSPERAQAWSENVGWLAGCNFTPSTAGNQLEMWQANTFDPETIERELAWASELGLNTIRVFLHSLVWETDGNRFLDRVDEMLAIAHSQGISVMPVLFDGVWNPHPRLGPQKDPRPRRHNAMWVQDPGAKILSNPARWETLKPYLQAVLSRFGGDSRVVVWDLFNECDQRNAISYARSEVLRKTKRADALLNKAFDWATEVDPDQPLTAGVFTGVSGAVELVSRANRTMLGRSDVISFHCYSRRRRLENAIDHLARYGRPLLCTEWLARPLGSTVDLLEVFAARQVGAYCWGLVDGRTQTRYSWTSWLREPADDDIWFHELLHADGTPFDANEALMIRAIAERNGPSPGSSANR